MNLIKIIKCRYIVTLVIITLSIISAVLVRVKEVEHFQGKYLSGYDSYFYYRQAKTIIAEGRLPERDYMQNYPNGLNLRGRANLNCYGIAYFYKCIQIILPDISVEKAAIYYPIILFIFILIILFILTKLLFGESISLIAVTIFATIPAVVYRTHAGWADRDPLSLLAWLVCIYFYLKAYQVHTLKKQYILFALLSGISMGALGLTWPGVGLLSIIIIVFNSSIVLTRSYDKKKFYIYLCWYIPSLLMMLLFTDRYSSNHHLAYTLAGMALPTLLTIVVPTLFTIVTCLTFLIKQVKTQWVRIGSFILLVTILVILLFALIPPQQLIETFLRPAGKGSFASTVSEFRKPILLDWFNWYELFFLFPIVGVMLVTYTVTKAYQIPAKTVTGMFTISLVVSIVGTHPNMQHRLIDYISLGCGILIIGLIGVSYFYNSFKKRIQTNLETELSLFYLIWVVLTLLYTHSAVRFALFLSPPAVILGATAIMFIFKRAIGDEKRRIAHLTKIICFLIFLWQLRNPFVTFLCNNGIDRIISSLLCTNLTLIGVAVLLYKGNQEFIGEMKRPMVRKVTCLILSITLCIIIGGIPYISSNWISRDGIADKPPENEIKVYDWLKTNTPMQSVIASWWVHGSRIEAIAERTTLVDQQHNIPRILSIAREVFCASTPDEALQFLKKHKATHLMITAGDVYGGILDLGKKVLLQDSAENLLMETFRISEDTINSEDTPQKTPIHQLSVKPISSEFKKEHYVPCAGDNIGHKYATVEYKADGRYHNSDITINETNISPMYFICGDRKEKNIEGLGTLVITNVDVHNPNHTLDYKHAVYFNEEVCNFLTYQLYFLNLHTEHFKQVYPTQEMQLQDSTQSDGTKIWKINY